VAATTVIAVAALPIGVAVKNWRGISLPLFNFIKWK